MVVAGGRVVVAGRAVTEPEQEHMLGGQLPAAHCCLQYRFMSADEAKTPVA